MRLKATFKESFLVFFSLLLLTVFVANVAAGHKSKSKQKLELHPKLKHVKAKHHNNEADASYWASNAQDYIKAKLTQQSNFNSRRARNVILFMGDGMSIHTLTATRQYMGDAATKLSFEEFPYFGLSKTFCVDKQVPDSASTSTAYLSGVKANYGTIGVTAEVPRSDCQLGRDTAHHTQSIAKWAQDAGLWTGVVTTARVTHASPSGAYAHVANREWENDQKIELDGCSAAENIDIARQLIEGLEGSRLRVVLGGGRRNFFSENDEDDDGNAGHRTDKRDLIKEWKQRKRAAGVQGRYVETKSKLLSTDYNSTDYLLGLFCYSHCPYHGDLKRDDLEDQIPSLSEMTEAALKMLQQSDTGYFLFVEAARIDMAHHDNRARLSLEDTEELSRAVQLARDMTNEEDTLIVVTSDHSHTMTIGGYPERDADILALNEDDADDDLPYTILSYANGPGYEKTYSKKKRKDLTDKDFEKPKRRYMAMVPLESETHGPDDVGIFASGPFAHYFSGNYLQSNIPVLMAKAADIGPFVVKRN